MTEVKMNPEPPRLGGKSLELDVNYSLTNYFAEAREVGSGPFMQRLSFTDAVRRFII